MNKLNLEEKIKKLKDQIADCREYISSDFCNNCQTMYKKIEEYEKELTQLKAELNNV
jgi:hypothetical protein